MDDKVFDLLEKLYIKVQALESNTATKDDIANIATKGDIANMATKDDIAKINQSIVGLEHKMDTNHKALYDGYKQTYEKLTTLEEKVDELDKKIERQDVEIRVIKGVK